VGGLQRLRLACRGPKPIAALKRYGLRPSVTTEKPHTSRELLQALTAADLAHASVLLVHYGERNDAIADALRARGARVDEVCPYVWAMPENIAPVTTLVDETIAGRIDAVLFTSQVQARHFFQIAGETGKADDLRSVLSADVVVAAIGPVCADALRQLGVTADVMPAAGNMASLVTAVADYFELTATLNSEL
jgi:uroporphyrinogen-III synthase